jgi:hypothetical protein
MKPRPYPRADVVRAAPRSAPLDALLRRLENQPPSRLASHDAPCCTIARSWLCGMACAAVSQLGNELGWISARWAWGPTCWPISWCEAIEEPELDCGALADLAATSLLENGHEVYRVQLVEQHAPAQIALWAARWREVLGSPQWIWGNLVYHEVVGVRDGPKLRLWDPARAMWRGPGAEAGGSRIDAIRAMPPAGETAIDRIFSLDWADLALPVRRWTAVP